MTSFLVFGNGALDHEIEGTFEAKGNSVIINAGNVSKVIELTDGPYTDGQKHRTKESIDDILSQFLFDVLPGGGGFNSAAAIRGIGHPSIQISYFDLSRPESAMVKELDYLNIAPYFLSKRDMPHNIVMRGPTEKLNLRGPNLERKSLEAGYHLERLQAAASQSASILINGAKDPEWVREIRTISSQANKRLFFGATDSLPQESLLEDMLPYGVVTLNAGELYKMFNNNAHPSDDDRLRFGLEMMRKWNSDFKHVPHAVYITLEGDGVYCTDKHEIFHIHLEGKIASDVNALIEQKIGTTTGAGDVFAGAITYLGTMINQGNAHPTSIAKLAQTASVRHIGYKETLSDRSFEAHSVTKTYQPARLCHSPK